MNIYDKNHKHHAVWKEYTESLLRGELLTVQLKSGSHPWEDAGLSASGIIHVAWSEEYQYRIAPKLKTIIVNDKEYGYPEPFTGELKYNQEYFVATGCNVRCINNFDESLSRKHVQMGLVHLDKESAEQHSKVIQQIFSL